MIKTFKEFLLEAEESQDEPATKEVTIGETSDGQKVKSVLKVGNTLEISPEEFTKLQNMRVTQYERDMLTHERGSKEYKISKDSEGKCTIFHYHKTLHKLMPIGVFMLPKNKDAKIAS